MESLLGRRFFLAGLSVALIFELATFALALTAISLHQTDSNTRITVLSALILSIVSTSLDCGRLYNDVRTKTKKSLLPAPLAENGVPESAAQFFTFGWVVPAAFGLIIAVKQPVCLSADDTLPVWRQGFGCKLHRVLVALSISIIITQYFLRRRRKASTLLHFDAQPLLSNRRSRSSTQSTSTTSLSKPDVIYISPAVNHQQQQQFQNRYLQRRSSLSSQRAVYPHGYSTFHLPSGHYTQHPYSGQLPFRPYAPSSRYTRSTIRSVSGTASMSISDRSSTFTSLTLPMPSSSRSSSALGSSCGSLHASTRRPRTAQLQSNCPAIPESPHLSSFPRLPVLSPMPTPPSDPPPAWCPPLRHAPLSADPAIRALTATHTTASAQMPWQQTRNDSTASSILRPSHWPQPPKAHVPPIVSSSRPKLLARARSYTDRPPQPGMGMRRVMTGTRMALRQPGSIRCVSNA